MKTLRLSWLMYVCISAVAIVLPLSSSPAFATAIGPGFDYFITPPGGAAIDLSFMGGPAVVPLTGIPLPNMALGSDTVVARMDPGPPEGGTSIIDIELVALHLRSVGPIDPDGSGPAPLGDLHITIDASDRFWTGTAPRPAGDGAGPSFFGLPTVPAPPSIGNMEMMHLGPGPHPAPSATMRACLGDPADPECAAAGTPLMGVPGGGIYATATLVAPGMPLGDPGTPVFFTGPAPRVALGSTGTYLHTAMNPREYGGIILGPITHVGPHPNAIPNPDNAAPEPSSVLLLIGFILGGGVRFRSRGTN
jgi:hypothetical protein